MVIDLEQAEVRLNSHDNPVRMIFRELAHGQPKGTVHRNTEQQAEIAALAVIKPYKEVAEKFNLSTGQVGNLARGRSDGEHLNHELINKTDSKLMEVRDIALAKTMMALGLLTPESVGKASARAVAGIAASMARIIDVTTKKESGNNQNVLVIYTPPQKEETKFQTVEIG
jgi:hypothetical protein